MKIRIFLTVFTLAGMSAAAQNRTMMDILTAHKWEADSYKKKGITIFETYTDTTSCVTFIYGGEATEKNYQYYLSDTVEHIFDPSRVGTAQYGEFMISKDMDRDNISCRKIVELNDSVFIFKLVPLPGEIRIGGGAVTFNAKPK